MVIWDCITISLNIEVHTARISRNFNGISKQIKGEGAEEEACKDEQARRGRNL